MSSGYGMGVEGRNLHGESQVGIPLVMLLMYLFCLHLSYMVNQFSRPNL